jgi:hypothetical protein
VQLVYLSKDDIRRDEERDPLLSSAALLIEEGVMTAADVRREYEAIEASLLRQVELAIRRPKLKDAAEVMASIVPPKREGVERPVPAAEARAALFADDAAQMESRSTWRACSRGQWRTCCCNIPTPSSAARTWGRRAASITARPSCISVSVRRA